MSDKQKSQEIQFILQLIMKQSLLIFSLLDLYFDRLENTKHKKYIFLKFEFFLRFTKLRYIGVEDGMKDPKMMNAFWE